MKNKSKTRKQLITALVILSILLTVLVGVLVYLGMSKQIPQGYTDSTDTAQTGVAHTTVPVEDLIINTKFCSLHLPGRMEGLVRTEFTESDNGGVIFFYGTAGEKEAQLFALFFSTEAGVAGSPVGQIDVNGTVYLISVLFNELDMASWTEEEVETMVSLQDGLNHMLDMLQLEPGFSQDFTVESIVVEDISVSAPYCELSFPGHWADQLHTEYTDSEEGGFVTFSGIVDGEIIPLFSIYFGAEGENSSPVGVLEVNGEYVLVSAQMYDIQDSGDLSVEAEELLVQMQEDINHVLSELTSVSGFTTDLTKTQETVAGPTQPEGDAESGEVSETQDGDLIVKTQWCDLRFPEQWRNQVRCEETSSGNGVVFTFCATVDQRDVVLFRILFNCTEDGSVVIGTVARDGASAQVSMVLTDYASDSSWNAEQLDEITLMQEQINYLLENLMNDPGFTSGK